jgi:hypothetical protein
VLYLSLHAPLLPAAEREGKLQEIAVALDFYPYVVDRYDEWIRDACGPFALGALPTSPFRDEFRSLLLLPDVPE